MLNIRLAAAVAAIMFIASSEATVRPGTCPDPRVMRIACDGTRAVEGKDCTDDDQCSAGRKCCDSPCGWKECFVAGEEVVGMPPPTFDYDGCPPHTMEACQVDRPKTCNSTTDCGFGNKCCPVSCNGMQCVAVDKKPGECEDPKRELADCMYNAWENSKAECAFDFQCDGNLKCCPQTCVKPLCKAPIKPGECPISIQGCPAGQEISNKCSDDYDCKGSQKCCSTGCGLACTYPAGEPKPDPVKPGECKPVNWAAIQCLAMDEEAKRIECSSDNDCSGEAKCCENPCTEKRCKLPAQCPYFDPQRACLVQNPSECTAGEKCDNGAACCEYECGGTRCEPELCPGVNPNIRCITTNKQECNSTDDCGADSICCSYECGGRRCVPRDVPAHSGYCPDYSNVKVMCPAVIPVDECSSDDECYAGKKCCRKICGGLGCLNTVSEPPSTPGEKPGQCPITIQGCPAGQEISNKCTDDSSCPLTQKCCSTGCGLACTVVVKDVIDPSIAQVKPGECPMSIMGCPADQEISNKCKDDSSCEGTQKCCSTGCGLACVNPVRDLPEPVSMPPAPAAQCPFFDPQRACLVKNPSECTVGEKCDNGAACCEYECGGTRCEPELCPLVNPDIRCVTTNKQECNSNDDCDANSICCSYECDGRKCVPRAVPAHGGYCPDYTNVEIMCPAVVPVDECRSDDECYAGKKCCRKICGGLGCVNALSHPPPPVVAPDALVCPVYNEKADCTTRRGAYTCNPGGKCDNGGQCCNTECGGTSCQSNLCPAPENIVCAKAETRDCESSATCAAGQICCAIHCGGTRCKPSGGSVPPVSGESPTDGRQVQGSPAPVCPAPSANPSCPSSLSRRACSGDSECGARKCCATGCGVNVCQTPVRPGTCPNPTVRCMEPSPSDKQNKCGTDMSCPGSQKCCPSPCPGFGASCVDPVV